MSELLGVIHVRLRHSSAQEGNTCLYVRLSSLAWEELHHVLMEDICAVLVQLLGVLSVHLK